MNFLSNSSSSIPTLAELLGSSNQETFVGIPSSSDLMTKNLHNDNSNGSETKLMHESKTLPSRTMPSFAELTRDIAMSTNNSTFPSLATLLDHSVAQKDVSGLPSLADLSLCVNQDSEAWQSVATSYSPFSPRFNDVENKKAFKSDLKSDMPTLSFGGTASLADLAKENSIEPRNQLDMEVSSKHLGEVFSKSSVRTMTATKSINTVSLRKPSSSITKGHPLRKKPTNFSRVIGAKLKKWTHSSTVGLSEKFRNTNSRLPHIVTFPNLDLTTYSGVFFCFDSPSPDDIIKNCQEKAYERDSGQKKVKANRL